MTEALNLAINFAFGELNLHRIMANHSPTNIRSANLLRRLNLPEFDERDKSENQSESGLCQQTKLIDIKKSKETTLKIAVFRNLTLW